MRITATNGQLPRRALESTLWTGWSKPKQSPRQSHEPHRTDDATVSPANDRVSLAGDESPRIKLSQHDGQSGGAAGTLALYDWTDDEMNRRRLEAIVAVKHTLIRRFEKGFMLRGVDIEVTLNIDNFA